MAAKSPDIEMDNRMRASCGLASTRNPSDLVIDALLSAPMGEYSGADDDGRFFQRTALVHVGARANQRYGRLTEEHTERVRQRLNEAISNAEELNEKTAALAAIGNSGDRELLSELTPHLEDSEALVRRQTVRSLRFMANPELDEVLITHSTSDEDVDVRMSATGTLSDRTRRRRISDAQAAAIGQSLATEQDGEVRSLQIGYLGRAVPYSTVAKEALVAHFREETRSRNLAYIGKFVSLHDLSSNRR